MPFVRSVLVAHNEEGIKEVKKEGFRSTTVRLPALFIRCSTLCLPLKALLFFISFNLTVIIRFSLGAKMWRLNLSQLFLSCKNHFGFSLRKYKFLLPIAQCLEKQSL